MKEQTLLLKEDFQLDKAEQANEIHFLTWAVTSTPKAGEVILEKNGKKMKLSYAPDVFEVKTEEILLPDPRLSNVWGDKIYRLILTDKKLRNKGSYTFRIEAM